MNFNLNFCITILIIFITPNNAEKVSCENVSDFDSGFVAGVLKSCEMEAKTAINSIGTTINSDRDESMRRLNLSNNKQIFYLPENVGEKFPNLLQYEAKDCSITMVSKKNFKGLTKLTKLNLWGNQIEKITNNVFEDLTELEVLSLGRELNFLKVFDHLNLFEIS